MPDPNALASIPLADWHGPGWWIVFVPLGWLTVAFLLFFLFRRVGWGRGCWGDGYGRADGGGWRQRSAPTAVLDRRFAEGEIDAEEYSARRSTLEKWDPDSGSDR